MIYDMIPELSRHKPRLCTSSYMTPLVTIGRSQVDQALIRRNCWSTCGTTTMSWNFQNSWAIIYARHTGPSIAAEMLDVIKSYQIQDKIGYFTLDNAKNNDTAMEIIGGELGFVGARRRGRCFGHILNLSAKASLFGHDADAFERRISGAEPLSKGEHLIWRKKGPAGKLHDLVVAIHRSDLLAGMLRNIQQEAFNKSSDPKLNARKPLGVILDNDTRWLSQLYMIRRALLLRDYIERLIAHHRIDFEQQNKAKRGGPNKLLTLPFICQPEDQLSDKD
jgi:hypothetical protein